MVSVYRLKNESDEKFSPQKHPGGQLRSARTLALIKNVKLKIESNSIRSMRKMAREAGVSEGKSGKLGKSSRITLN